VVRLLPKIYKFLEQMQPDALVVGAGFDAHRDDDMSGLAFTVDLYRQLGVFVRDIAREFTDNRVVSILEGGYNLSKLGSCVEAYLMGLVETDK
jgi:acetoin utilization deacetylase AcuC-like enzyme